MSEASFQSAYLEGRTPWDIGRPQSDLARLCDSGAITGRVLDVGCGTGENALYAASLGLDVVGVDGAPAAIDRARRKADVRGLSVTFEVGDVLSLEGYAGAFNSAMDCGCFHVFDDSDRLRYVSSLHTVLREHGRLFLLCFSDRVPGDWGPRRVTRQELHDAFAGGWRIDTIDPAHFDVVNLDTPRIDAWLAALTRI